jgi:septal ring factor EnvC (AmiA/AmiB activator)
VALKGRQAGRPWVLLAAAVLVVGMATATPAGDLRALREDLKKERIAAEKESHRAEGIFAEIRALDERLLASSRKLKNLEIEENLLTSEYESELASLEKLEALRHESREKLGQRIARIYRRGRLGNRQVLFQAATSSEPLRMARYMTALSRADAVALKDYERDRKSYEESLLRVDAKRAESRSTRESLEHERERNSVARKEKKAVLARVKGGLHESQLRVERLEDAEKELAAITARPSPPARLSRSVLTRLFRSRPGSFVERKGKLDVPVKGDVLRRFGDRLRLGGEMKGIDVRVSGDRPVRAVHGGEVVFAGPFPGLGSTVIVNHGDRYHTVYARLGSIEQEVGDRVSSGQSLGRLSRPDDTLHFELRAEGKALDPGPWIGGGYREFSR